jgi:hypothetical protein
VINFVTREVVLALLIRMRRGAAQSMTSAVWKRLLRHLAEKESSTAWTRF